MIYLLFAGADYYPDGGMMDFVGQFTAISEAQFALSVARESDEFSFQWAHVAELVNGKVTPILEWYESGNHPREWGPFIDWRKE